MLLFELIIFNCCQINIIVIMLLNHMLLESLNFLTNLFGNEKKLIINS